MGRQDGAAGFSLVEVIIAAALIGAGLLLVACLIPSGVLSLKKSEDLQTATAYGVEVMEVTRAGLERTAHLGDFHVTINQTEFHVTREFSAVDGSDGRLYDVVVVVAWNGQPAPVQLATRMSQPDTP